MNNKSIVSEMVLGRDGGGIQIVTRSSSDNSKTFVDSPHKVALTFSGLCPLADEKAVALSKDVADKMLAFTVELADLYDNYFGK
jgi:hypothetical protein